MPSTYTQADAYSLPGWSGEEFFKYMRKVSLVGSKVSFLADREQAETFHTKPWFKADEKAHGYDGPLHTEPHDLAPISELLLKSMEDQGLPLVPDMFSNGETPNGSGHVPRTGE
jgi:choline dehydrogenase-like flavoprotein